MNNKSFAYEQGNFRQSFHTGRQTRSYPSALTTYIQYIRRSQLLVGRKGKGIEAIAEETNVELNPYARLFMIIWALAMVTALSFRTDKAANPATNDGVELTNAVSPPASSVDKLAHPFTTAMRGASQNSNR